MKWPKVGPDQMSRLFPSMLKGKKPTDPLDFDWLSEAT